MRGFPCVAALFIASIVPVSSYLMDNVEPDKKDGAWTACWTSTVAFIGLAVHGAVPLHEDVSCACASARVCVCVDGGWGDGVIGWLAHAVRTLPCAFHADTS